MERLPSEVLNNVFVFLHQRDRFEDTSLPDGFDHFLSCYFPNLRYLKFTDCKFNNRTLNIPNLSLLRLQVEQHQCHDEYKIAVTAGSQRCYSLNTSFQSLVYLQRNADTYKTPYRSVPTENVNGDPDLTIICASLDKVYVCSS